MVRVVLEPSKLSGNVGEKVSVTATVYDVANLYSFDVCLDYDSNVLKCAELTVGPFITPADPSKIQVYQSILNGRCCLGAMLTSPEEPKSGSGALCYVKFEVLKQGYTEIKLTSSLLDPNANSIDHEDVGATFGEKPSPIMETLSSIVSNVVALLTVVALVSIIKLVKKK